MHCNSTVQHVGTPQLHTELTPLLKIYTYTVLFNCCTLGTCFTDGCFHTQKKTRQSPSFSPLIFPYPPPPPVLAQKVGEFDTPANLVANQNSLLMGFVRQTGAGSSRRLVNIANNSTVDGALGQIVNSVTATTDSTVSPSSSAAGAVVEPFAAAAGGVDISSTPTLEPALLGGVEVEAESSSPAAGAEPPTASGSPTAPGPEEVDGVLEAAEGGGKGGKDEDEGWGEQTE